MASKSAADLSLIISREQGRNAVKDALDNYVGTGRPLSVHQLSKRSGVPPWQINAAKIKGTSPDNRPLPPESILSIAAALEKECKAGAQFLCEILNPAAMVAFAVPEVEEGHEDADDKAGLSLVLQAALAMTVSYESGHEIYPKEVADNFEALERGHRELGRQLEKARPLLDAKTKLKAVG